MVERCNTNRTEAHATCLPCLDRCICFHEIYVFSQDRLTLACSLLLRLCLRLRQFTYSFMELSWNCMSAHTHTHTHTHANPRRGDGSTYDNSWLGVLHLKIQDWRRHRRLCLGSLCSNHTSCWPKILLHRGVNHSPCRTLDSNLMRI